jgi:hypothetical protein
MEGLVDAYYMYNFTGDTAPFHSQTTPQGAPAFTRAFDLNSNSFTLNYAKVAVGMNADPVALRMDLGYGATGYLINFATFGSNGQSQVGTGAVNSTTVNSVSAFLVQQAFASLTLSGLTIDLGKFTTTAGAEVIEANKNWNYSRSILFSYIPLLHTGLRGTYKVSDALTVQASLVNGWNDLGFEGYVTPGKTIGVSINYTAPSATNVILNGYFGPEPTAAGSPSTSTWRNLVDLVVAQTIGNLGLNFNFDYINQANDPTGGLYDGFFGVAGMGRYQVNDHLALALRAEFAQTGPSGGRIKLFEGTFTAAFPLASHFEFRAELRGDDSGGPTGFPGDFNMMTSKGVFTGTGAFLAWF